jgi:hypothetical protein
VPAQRVSPLTDVRLELNWTLPPDLTCVWCGAIEGASCHVRGPVRRMRQTVRLSQTPGGSHPSRVAA